MSTKYYDWSAYHASMRGDKVAIVDLDTQEEVTYGALEDRASRLAEWLQSQGVIKGDRVTLLTPNSQKYSKRSLLAQRSVPFVFR